MSNYESRLGERRQLVITELHNVDAEGYEVMMKSKGRRKGYKKV
jgi:hypothetical protein